VSLGTRVPDVGRVLERLGIVSNRRGSKAWSEQCPLARHETHNPDHRFANWFIRAEGTRSGQHHCFSCKGGGSLADLVIDVLKIDTGDSRDDVAAARHWLATIEEQEPPAPYLRVRFEAMRPQGFRLPPGVDPHVPLEQWNSVPRAYLEGRGIGRQQVQLWGVCCAHEGRLAGRIVFPTFNMRGQLANYTARTFVGDEKRYLAASTWEGPDLSALYGEHLWPRDSGKRSGVVVFEGAINGLAIERALACPQGQFAHVCLAGLSGSQLGPAQAAKLATFRRIVVATDPDQAGEGVGDELRVALEGPPGRRRCEVRRVRYPGGADAAETQQGELLAALAQCLI
jgi:Toprim-like